MTQAAFNFATTASWPDQAGLRVEPRVVSGPPAVHPVAAPAAGPANALDPGDAIGFEYARYGLVPPAACLWPGHPIREGWERGRRLLSRRTRPATLAVSRWLALRLAAWTAGEAFDDHQITPTLLRSLEVASQCPVTGRDLHEDAQVVPVDDARGWVAGNLVLLHPSVAARFRALDWVMATAALARAEAEPDAVVEGLSLRQWRRIVTLKSLATPLPDEVAAAIPLHVLPPNRLRLVNPVQELQAMLTLQLATPGWGQRARGLADSMPRERRNDFNLFFNSLLAQALRQGQGAGRSGMRDALVIAWGDTTVQRRWHRFADGLGAELAETLVDRLAQEPMPGMFVLRHGEVDSIQKMAA